MSLRERLRNAWSVQVGEFKAMWTEPGDAYIAHNQRLRADLAASQFAEREWRDKAQDKVAECEALEPELERWKAKWVEDTTALEEERDALQTRIERVEKLVEKWEASANVSLHFCARDLREALTGERRAAPSGSTEPYKGTVENPGGPSIPRPSGSTEPMCPECRKTQLNWMGTFPTVCYNDFHAAPSGSTDNRGGDEGGQQVGAARTVDPLPTSTFHSGSTEATYTPGRCSCGHLNESCVLPSAPSGSTDRITTHQRNTAEGFSRTPSGSTEEEG